MMANNNDNTNRSPWSYSPQGTEFCQRRVSLEVDPSPVEPQMRLRPSQRLDSLPAVTRNVTPRCHS